MEFLNTNAANNLGIIALTIVGGAIFYFFMRKYYTRSDKSERAELQGLKDETPKTFEPLPQPDEIPWFERLQKGLGRSSSEIWGKLEKILTGSTLTDDAIEQMEELLYAADLGPLMVTELVMEFQEKVKDGVLKPYEFKLFFRDFLHKRLKNIQEKANPDLYTFDPNNKKLKVIMVVGVNGAGKTTTIGKLATKLQSQGAKVIVGACDTFRAAAVDQLQVWCDRAKVEMVRAKEGAAPSGVAYETLAQAMKSGADYCILDTAGRLHTKENLMEELSKSKRVLAKLDPTAPHETLLVIDAITGQNAIRQADEFNKMLGVTGLIFTKCDGSSKAGSAISIVTELKIPIVYIGVGESVEDLNIFNLNEYLRALLNLPT